MTTCAYCKQKQPATREHVIPSFMYAFQKELEQSVIGWNEVIEKMARGESKVKDVCASCNNGTLGILDAHAKKLFVDSGLLVQNYVKSNLVLRYDFALLLRWLLKVSFNSSRTDGAHSHLFERHIPFMLGTSPIPSRSKVAPIAYLAAPEYLGKSRIQEEPFSRVAQDSKVLNPFLVRICYGAVQSTDEYTLRINIFGPLVFYMLMFREDVLPGHAAAAIRRFLKGTAGAVELTPQQRVIQLHAGKQSWLDLYEYQIRRSRALAKGG